MTKKVFCMMDENDWLEFSNHKLARFMLARHISNTTEWSGDTASKVATILAIRNQPFFEGKINKMQTYFSSSYRKFITSAFNRISEAQR